MRRFTSHELFTKLETIFESTWLYHTLKHTHKALSQDDLRSAVMGRWIKPTYEWEAVHGEWAGYLEWASTKLMKWSLLNVTNKSHSTSRMNRTCRAEQLHNRSTPMEEMLPRRSKCTYKDQEPTDENHCTARSALLLKYTYRYITRMQRHLWVKPPYGDEKHKNVNHCTLGSAFMLETFTHSKIGWDCGNCQENIWDARYDMNCVHAVQKPPSRTLRLTEL